jgi:hypothetical protein
MKSILSFLMIMSAMTAQAVELPKYQRLAPIQSLQTDGAFPISTITVRYIRSCHEVLVDTLTRSQIAAGKNYLEVGVLLEKVNRICRMHEPAFISETAMFRISTELPIVLLELDLSVDLRAPISPGGSSVGNFSDPQ